MEILTLPKEAQQVLLADAAARDRSTTRRLHLFEVLWNERFLTRAQLVVRLEGLLGAGCFGEAAWEDTFYRDMRVVKEAFKKAGFLLRYSRSKTRPGYYLHGQPRLHPMIKQALHGSISEVDPVQQAVFKQQSPAARFRQGCAISDTARRAVIHRVLRRQPDLSVAEASMVATRSGREDS